MTASTGYIHCVPAVSLEESYPSSSVHSPAGLTGYDLQQGRGRPQQPLAVVELSIDNTCEKPSKWSSASSLDKQVRHSKGFPIASNSRARQLRLSRLSAASTERIESKAFLHEARNSKDKATSWKKARNSRGSACTSVERVYKPTLPKYCFSASTYQSVLTDYSTSAGLGMVRGDLSQLPPPRHTLMTRELPYVYRYKIQQGITSLNNMIPTRRDNSHPVNQIW